MRLSGIAETGGRRILAVWLGVAACCPQAGAVELLRIHGTTYRALCNPLTGDVYTDSVRRSAFTLVMAGHQWRISAEDLADSGLFDFRAALDISADTPAQFPTPTSTAIMTNRVHLDI